MDRLAAPEASIELRAPPLTQHGTGALIMRAQRVGSDTMLARIVCLVAEAQRSRATMRNIRQNLFLAFVYNVIGIPIAAGVLYPAFGVLLSPIIAVTSR